MGRQPILILLSVIPKHARHLFVHLPKLYIKVNVLFRAGNGIPLFTDKFLLLVVRFLYGERRILPLHLGLARRIPPFPRRIPLLFLQRLLLNRPGQEDLEDCIGLVPVLFGLIPLGLLLAGVRAGGGRVVGAGVVVAGVGVGRGVGGGGVVVDGFGLVGRGGVVAVGVEGIRDRNADACPSPPPDSTAAPAAPRPSFDRMAGFGRVCLGERRCRLGEIFLHRAAQGFTHAWRLSLRRGLHQATLDVETKMVPIRM